MTTATSPTEYRRKRFRFNPWLVFTYGVLIVFSLLYIGPIFMLVSTALKSLPEFYRNPTGWPSEIMWSNFPEAWKKANFPLYLLNTAIYTAVATAIFVLTSLYVAFPIARGYFKGHQALFTLYVIALFLPPALIPQFQLWLNLGLVNTRHGYIMLFLVNAIGMMILVQYMRSIPRELDESAAVDGATYGRFVWKIIFPLIRPAVATVTVLHAIGIWNEIVLPTIYLFDSEKFPITRGLIVFQGVYGSDWPGLAAAVLMLMLPMAVLFIFMQRYIISGLTAGSVKG